MCIGKITASVCSIVIIIIIIFFFFFIFFFKISSLIFRISLFYALDRSVVALQNRDRKFSHTKHNIQNLHKG